MMALKPIKYGVGTHSDNGKIFGGSPEKIPKDAAEKIFERDNHTCQFCGFKSEKYQNVLFTGDTEKDRDTKNFVTACSFCHQCFHIDKIPYMQSGALIWMPEISQAELNNICRAIYIARITQGPVADAAREALDLLMARKEEAKNRLGTDDLKVLATIFQDFMEAKEYKMRHSRIKGFRVLPLDRRLVREGELEFNQFPQMLAYWRSANGPYGKTPPRSWTELFYTLRENANSGVEKTSEAPPVVEEAEN
jgi:intracellular multiplication protein IcmJ